MRDYISIMAYSMLLAVGSYGLVWAFLMYGTWRYIPIDEIGYFFLRITVLFGLFLGVAACRHYKLNK